jgi:hypothetical protein
MYILTVDCFQAVAVAQDIIRRYSIPVTKAAAVAAVAWDTKRGSTLQCILSKRTVESIPSLGPLALHVIRQEYPATFVQV